MTRCELDEGFSKRVTAKALSATLSMELSSSLKASNGVFGVLHDKSGGLGYLASGLGDQLPGIPMKTQQCKPCKTQPKPAKAF